MNNTGTLTGNVNMGAGTNIFNASAAAQLPSGTLTADPAGTSTLNLSGAGADLLNIAVTNFQVLNKDGTGTWTIGQAISLSQAINVNSGFLSVDDASFLGANTIVNNAGPVGVGGVIFTNVAAGPSTYSGNMSGTGVVQVGTTGAGITVFSGTNTYTGGTYIDNGTLRVTGGAALSDTGSVFIGGLGGTLDVAQTETIGGLNDDAGVPGFVDSFRRQPADQQRRVQRRDLRRERNRKDRRGDFTLSGANTFTGPAIVTDGILALAGGAAIADGTAVIVNATSSTSGELDVNAAETIGSLAGNGGTVVLNADLTTGGDNTNTQYDGIIQGTGALIKNGTGTFTITGANTYTGGTTINNGTLEGNSTSLRGSITDNAPGTLLFTQPADGTFAGSITGNGTVTKAGGGVLTLTGNNSGHIGTTNLNAGMMSIGAATNIGTGVLSFDGGGLQTTGVLTLGNLITLAAGGGTVQTDADTTLTGVISGPGALTKTGVANLILTGANTYGGGTTVSAGTLTGTTTSLQGNILDNAALVFNQAGAGAYAGNLTGTGSVTISGGGAVTFSGINTYSGPTNITAGSLTAGGTGIGDSSDVTVALGATLNITAPEVIGSLAGDGSANLGASTLTTGGSNASTTFTGAITNGALVKTGTGTMTLTGASVLAGGLAVNGGGLTIGATGSVDTTVSNTSVTGATLTVDGTLTGTELDVNAGGAAVVDVGGAVNEPVHNFSGGLVRVNGTVTGNITNDLGATLAGAGTINGAVSNSGTVAPGNSPGIITISGSFVQTATGTLAAELTPSAVPGTGYDQVHVIGAPGTATLDGTLALTPAAGLYVDGATYDVVDATGGITGTFATVTGNVISPFITLDPTGIVTVAGSEQVYRLTVVRTTYAAGMGAGATPNQIAVANGFQVLVPGAVW